MRKLILSAFFIVSATTLFAQKGQDKNMEKIQELVGKEKYTEAKDLIDAAAADPKNQSNSDFWFIKAKAYNNLAKAKQDSAMQAESLAAIQKYFELESTKEESKRAVKSVLEGHQTAFDIYSTYFKGGVQDFQNQKWQQAHYKFDQTLNAFNLISKNKLSNVTFDTTAVLYAGYSAQNARLNDKAVQYYTQIADLKVADTNYLGVYEYLIGYYQEKKDVANAQKYIDLGKSLFPTRDIWLNYELQSLDGDKTKKLARLDELTKQNPQNAELQMEYAVDLFNYTYGKDKPSDYEKRKEDITVALKKSIELNNSSAYARYILTQHMNNQVYDLQQTRSAIKGTKPEDVKKKQEINKQIDALIEEQSTHALAAYEIYEKAGANIKPAEKASFKAVTNLLIDYYTMKKQADKVKLYEAKIDTIK